MLLKDKFKSDGDFLFRWRSYIPLIILPLIIGSFILEYKETENSFNREMISLGIALFGLWIRIITIGRTPKNTSGRNTKEGQVADVLNTKGIYSVVRNPLYLGNYFMMLGVVDFIAIWWLNIIFSLLFWLYYERIIYAEEQFLEKKFGEVYANWAKNTPAFIPKFSGFKKSDMNFSFKNILKREYSGFFNTFLSMYLLEIFKVYYLRYFTNSNIEINECWTYMFAGSFIIIFILRSLKKYTKVLEVEGR